MKLPPIYTLGDLRAMPAPKPPGLDIEPDTDTITLHWGPRPVEVDLALCTDASELLGWIVRLAAEPWMTGRRLRRFIIAAADMADIGVYGLN